MIPIPDFNLGTAHGLIDIDTTGVDAAGRRLTSAGRQMLGFGTALAAGFVTAVKTAADFEKEISAIQAVTASTDEEVNTLREAAMDLGSQGPFGPTQVAEAFLELAKAGLTATEIIDGAGVATINLAKAGDLDIARAAEIAANAMRTFGIEAKDVNGIVDTLSGAANQSTLDVEDLAVSMRYTGGVAAALQIPIEDVATALALLGNAGIKGSTGGTSLRRILLQLSPDSKEARKELENLGIITEDGANQFFNAAGEAKDLNTVFQILRDSTAELTDEQKINSINTIFGARASAAALILMEQAGQGFVDMDTAISKTDAATVAAERLDNLSGAARRLKAAVQAYLIDAGSPFQKQLQGMVESITKFINKLNEGDSAWGRWIILGTLFAGIFFIITGAMTLALGSVFRFVIALQILGKAFVGTIILMTRFTSFLTVSAIPAMFSFIATIYKAAQAMAAFFAVNPLVALILIIIAIGVALFLLYKRHEGFRKFVDNLWQTMQQVWDKILPVVYAIGRALVWAANTAKDAWDASYPTLVKIGEIIVKVAKIIGKAVTDIIDFFRDLPGNVVHNIDVAFGAVVNFFQSLPGLAVQGLAALGRAILAGLARLPYLFGFAIGFIIGAWIGLQIKLFQIAIEMMFRLGQLILEGLQKLASLMLEGLGWLISHAVQFALDFPGRLFGFLNTLAGLLIQGLIAVTLALVGWITDMITKAINFSIDFGEGMMKEIPKLPGRIAGILVEISTKMAGWITEMIGYAAELGLKFLGKIWEEFKQLPQTIINAIKSAFDIATLLVDIGEQIIKGLIKGVKNMAGAAKDAVGDVVNGIKDGFKSGFGLFSPSKVTTEYGKMVSQGLISGMESERNHVVRLIDSMAGDLDRLNNIQKGMNPEMNIGSLLPVSRSDRSPVTVRNGNTVNTTINNPIGETSEESMFLTAQKLQYLGVF